MNIFGFSIEIKRVKNLPVSKSKDTQVFLDDTITMCNNLIYSSPGAKSTVYNHQILEHYMNQVFDEGVRVGKQEEHFSQMKKSLE